MSAWKLKRTVQCQKCPWRTDVNAHDIPNGYDLDRHRALSRTIASVSDPLSTLTTPTNVMACHETDPGQETHCVGWLVNQIGPGNNIGLRIQMLSCQNVEKIRTVGTQRESFENTIP